MIGRTSNKSPTLVTGIFWEPFSAARAIAALLRRGFSDRNVHAVGVLEGHADALSEFLVAAGLSSDIAALYGDCFDDGAVLVMVRVDQADKEGNIAIDLLKEHGGVYTRQQLQPPDCNGGPLHRGGIS